MDKAKLKALVIDELVKTLPAFEGSGLKDINEPLIDNLVDEYCLKNPEEFAVLNPLGADDEKLSDIKEDVAVTIERLKYKKVVNNAGLAYQGSMLLDKLANYGSKRK